MTVLLLPPPPADYEGPEECGEMTCVVLRDLEACGRAFEDFYCAMFWLDDATTTAVDTPEKRAKQQQRQLEQKKRNIKAVKLTEAELHSNHYEVLGLEKLEWNATEDQIKAAYRKLVVETHPDKTQGGDDTAFKAVQKAYEVLSDPQKRLAYDSSIPFDDDIPSLKVTPEEFFEEFGDAFHRNSRWSTARNVPELGDWSTPVEEVEAFYEFWSSFRSWRDFTHIDMHDPEQAECREEKRWMERENERERSKLQRQEYKRIRELVDRARALDPRLKKYKEDLVRQKEEEKLAAAAAKRQKQQAKLQRQREVQEAEERRLKEEAERKKAEQAKKKEERTALRVTCAAALKPFITTEVARSLLETAVCKPDIEWVFGKCDLEGLQALKAALEDIATQHGCTLNTLSESCTTAVVAQVNQLILETEQRLGYDRFGNNLKKARGEAEKKEGKGDAGDGKKDVWTEQELCDLAKAIAKFPGGSFNRWDNIAVYIGTKTPDQVLRRTKMMTHQLHEGQPPVKPDILKQGDAKPLQGPKAEEAAAPAAVDDTWTKAQQKALEDALKTLKDYKDKDKWDKIAALVEGKSKKQCVDRYKYLATLFKK